MKKKVVLLFVSVLFCTYLNAQRVGSTPEYIKFLTSEWVGERLPDGRPFVSDEFLERLKNISIEEAWGVLRNRGYHNQYEGNWKILRPNEPMTGRVVTAQFMPERPDYFAKIKELGIKENRSQSGVKVTWPIDALIEGDIYVADGYGKVAQGTLMGDNLGNAIFARSKRGVIFNGGVRDLEGILEIDGFNGWIRGQHPSFMQESINTSINTPIRIGNVTVLPGDVVLAKEYGVIFIPSHLVEEVVITSEMTMLRDEFGHLRLKEKKYLAGEIDSVWSDEIRSDFIQWVNSTPGKNPITRKQLDKYLEEKNF
jgi:4-hydroxy-4-methyl-2-oxoglutarate aldolase